MLRPALLLAAASWMPSAWAPLRTAEAQGAVVAQAFEREIACRRSVLEEHFEADLWRAQAESEQWVQRALAFDTLARRAWLRGPPSSDERLTSALERGRADPHPAVRAAAWAASLAWGAALGANEFEAAAEEPLSETRLAAARLAGPPGPFDRGAADPAPAARLARDGQPAVARAARLALLRWALAGRSSQAIPALLESLPGDPADWAAEPSDLLWVFEQLEALGSVEEPARVLAQELERREVPPWLILGARVLGVQPGQPLDAHGLAELVVPWSPAREQSARLGALLSRRARGLGLEFGRALLAEWARHPAVRSLDDALEAIGPALAAELALELPRDPLVFGAFLERARFAELLFSDGVATRTWERCADDEQRALCLAAFENHRPPCPRSALHRIAADRSDDFARRAFGILAHEVEPDEARLLETWSRAGVERQAQFEAELPLERGWPAFFEVWSERGERLPSLRGRLALRLARANPVRATGLLSRWYRQAFLLRFEGAQDRQQERDLAQLFEVLSHLDPEPLEARARELFLALDGRPGALVRLAGAALIQSPGGRALVSLWLARGFEDLGRSGQELALQLLGKASPAEPAVRLGAIDYLGQALALGAQSDLDGMLLGLAAAPEPEALVSLEALTHQLDPRILEAVTSALAERAGAPAVALLERLARRSELGVARMAALGLARRADGFEALERLAAGWPDWSAPGLGSREQVEAELDFVFELLRTRRGIGVDGFWSRVVARAGRLAADEFSQPLEFGARRELRFEELLRAFEALVSAPGDLPRSLERDLAPLPPEILEACGDLAASAGRRELARRCLELALAAYLGESQGPGPALTDALRKRMALSGKSEPALMRLMSCSAAR